jgi:hypothetical protein
VKRKICRITLNILVYCSYLPRVSLSYPVSNVTVTTSNLKVINVGRNVLPQYELIVLQISCAEGT